VRIGKREWGKWKEKKKRRGRLHKSGERVQIGNEWKISEIKAWGERIWDKINDKGRKRERGGRRSEQRKDRSKKNNDVRRVAMEWEVMRGGGRIKREGR